MILDLPSGPLALDRAVVMGILNRTSDSFYAGARHADLDAAVERGREMAAEGAAIIDVGGEKAGPGEPVSVRDEIERVVPVIEALRACTSAAISVDTFKAPVARAAVAAGADIINSIGGFTDPRMIEVAAGTGAAVVIMHIQGQPRVAQPHPTYTDVVTEVRDFLLERAAACTAAGIPENRIVIDPGPGFGKTPEHDIEILRRLSTLTSLRYPVLLAASRKGFIGAVVGGGPEDRLEGSLAVATWGVLAGVRIVRTHDVRATARVCRMADAVMHEIPA